MKLHYHRACYSDCCVFKQGSWSYPCPKAGEEALPEQGRLHRSGAPCRAALTESPLQAQGAEMEIQNPFLKESSGFPFPLQLEAPQQLEIRPVFM